MTQINLDAMLTKTKQYKMTLNVVNKYIEKDNANSLEIYVKDNNETIKDEIFQMVLSIGLKELQEFLSSEIQNLNKVVIQHLIVD